MDIARHGSDGILEPDPNQPRNRGERPCKTHTRADHPDRVVHLSISQVVERLGESKLTHNIESEPAKALIGGDGLCSIFSKELSKLAGIGPDLSLV